MADRKHPWEQIEQDYLGGVYDRLKDIAEATGISYRMVQKRSADYGWAKKKAEIKKDIEKKIIQDIKKDAVSEAKKVREQLNSVANLLLKQGTQRFIDPETGLPYKRAIENVQTAISALSAGAKIKMALNDIKGENDGNGETNVFNFGDSSTEISFRGISDAELEHTHRQLAEKFGIGSTKRGKSGNRGKKKGKK